MSFDIVTCVLSYLFVTSTAWMLLDGATGRTAGIIARRTAEGCRPTTGQIVSATIVMIVALPLVVAVRWMMQGRGR